MNKTTLIKWGGVAAFFGTLLITLGAVDYEASNETIGIPGSLLLIYGLFSLYAVQAQESGWAGFLGFVLSVAGGFFLTSSYEFGGFPLALLGVFCLALGFILFGVGSLAAGFFPRWVSWLWIGGVLIGLPAVAIPTLETALGVAGSGLWTVGMAGVAYSLWKRD